MSVLICAYFVNDTATREFYTYCDPRSLRDAFPLYHSAAAVPAQVSAAPASRLAVFDPLEAGPALTAAQADPTAVQNRQDQKEAFLKTGSTGTQIGRALCRERVCQYV